MIFLQRYVSTLWKEYDSQLYILVEVYLSDHVQAVQVNLQLLQPAFAERFCLVKDEQATTEALPI